MTGAEEYIVSLFFDLFCNFMRVKRQDVF